VEAQQNNIQSIDERLWTDVRQALNSIAQHAEDILAQWVVVGQRLIDLRKRNPGDAGSFGIACRTHGIGLTAQQRSTAMWWAQLDERQRDVLSEKAPDALTPSRLQEVCREKHPEWARVRKSSGFTARETVKKQEKTTSTLPLKMRRQIEAEIHRDEVKALREKKAAAAAEAAANDRRPKLTETPFPVVMYGRQLWPLTDAERVNLGQYDYDQLVLAVRFFIHQRDISLPEPPHDMAKNLRLRVRFLNMFIERRLTQPADLEMRRFLEVFTLLCGLLESNPDGECRPPSDRALFNV
jgi:hypothetical protein